MLKSMVSRQNAVSALVAITFLLVLWFLFSNPEADDSHIDSSDNFILNHFTVPPNVPVQKTSKSFAEVLQSARQLLERSCVQFVCKRGKNGFRLSDLGKFMKQKNTVKDSTTVVTEYFNIGYFRKGTTETRTESTYALWVKTFQLVLNDVIMFTDDSRFAQYFLNLRSASASNHSSSKTQKQASTCVCVVNSTSFWSFALLPRIAHLQSLSVLPRFEPQTTVPLYDVVMHTKYAALEIVAEANIFDATYLSWLDIGAFRDLVPLVRSLRPFYIVPPVDYDPEKVAYTQIRAPSFNLPISYYFQANIVWLSGSFFFAELGTMLAFAHQYRFAAERTIEMGFASSDQQVLCCMYSAEMMGQYSHPLVHVQVYEPSEQSSVDVWFYLAYLCRHTYLLSVNRNLYNYTVQYRDPRPLT